MQHAPHLLERQMRIVDVGCGTGEQTLGLEKLFPGADIIGVDVNAPSLALAQKLAQRVRSKVRFIEADICRNLSERLHDLATGPFDLVCSMGVIHHLKDPRVGFTAVRKLVGPEGLFYGCVYSAYGRREDMAIKSLLDEIVHDKFDWNARSDAMRRLRLANVNSLLEHIKRLRQRLRFGPPISIRELLQVAFRRDLMVHDSDTYSNPCEHLYRFGELRSQVTEAGWKNLFLARGGGLPTKPSEHTNRTWELALLGTLPEDPLYDYFAFYYRAQSFYFFCQ